MKEKKEKTGRKPRLAGGRVRNLRVYCSDEKWQELLAFLPSRYEERYQRIANLTQEIKNLREENEALKRQLGSPAFIDARLVDEGLAENAAELAVIDAVRRTGGYFGAHNGQPNLYVYVSADEAERVCAENGWVLQKVANPRTKGTK